MLKYEIAHRSRREPAEVVVLLHGRGSDMYDMVPLGQQLGDRTVVAPQAPFPGAPWGYGPGWAWYQFMGRNVPGPNSFTQSLADLHAFLRALPGELGVSNPHIILGGFSQGGTLSTAYAVVHPGEVGRVLNFSGFLADHPQVQVTPETVKGTRFFWGHGRADGSIPFDLAIEGRATLSEAGADLEARDYDIGHWIDPHELQDAVAWLSK